MPKEVVQFPSTDQHSGTELSVHWTKEQGWVQLGVTRHVWTPPAKDAVASIRHGDHSACTACVDAMEDIKARQKAGEPEMFTDCTHNAGPPVGDYDSPATVFTEVMSRDEINRMIRALRRARDQAYGADA